MHTKVYATAYHYHGIALPASCVYLSFATQFNMVAVVGLVQLNPLKPVLGGAAGVAHVITGHKRLNKTEFATFISLM